MIPGLLEAATALGGMVIPPVFDVIKRKLLGISEDSSEGTLSALARSNPEVMTGYVRAKAELYDAEARFFNRDIAGTPSTWVIDLRGAIRPSVTLLSVCALIIEAFPFASLGLDQGTRATMCLIVSSWFGDRLFNKDAGK